jgi:hypothetical protein
MSSEYSEWLELGRPLVDNHRDAKWRLGDWLAQAQYDEDIDEATKECGQPYANWIKDASQSFQYKYETFLEFRRVAKAFPEPTRVGALSWNHHRVVVTVADPDKRAEWLQKALKKGWTVGELRTKMEHKTQKQSQFTFSEPELKKIKDLVRKTNLPERDVVRMLAKKYLKEGDLKSFVDLYKVEKPVTRIAYQTELKAKNGGTLKRYKAA